MDEDEESEALITELDNSNEGDGLIQNKMHSIISQKSENNKSMIKLKEKFENEEDKIKFVN